MSTIQKRLDSLAEKVRNELPSEVNVESVQYEGPELVITTTTPEQFASSPELLQQVAVALQKRVTVRPSPDIRTSQDQAEEIITSTAPDQAKINNITFSDETNEVFIEAERPGMVIGRSGETLRQITAKTGWDAQTLRTPPLESDIVRNVRGFLTQEREERQEIMQRIGRQIHREPTSDEQHVRVTTLGCCREVGRAAFVLSTGETRILVDCGDKPGSDDVPYLQVPEGIASGAHSLDAVVLTHAHLDHSALVPLLYKYGYDGPIYCTQPTRDLMGLLSLDYLNVAGKQGRTPPYESEHVREALKHTITLDYSEMTEVAPDTRVTFQNAGHILGSAVTHFQINEGEHSVVFSGDIHKEETKLFNGAVNQFPGADSLIMESTYGQHGDTSVDQADAEDKLKTLINSTYQDGGKVLIPAFAVGRSQEIMLVLEEAMRNGEIPKMPIHLDGMIGEATAVHTSYPEYLRDEVRNRIFHADENPFMYDAFNQIDGGEDERQRIKDGDPCIILTTSGMLTGGPIMSWLKHIAPDEKSTLTFVGYQAPGTLGRDIQQGERKLQLGDDMRGRQQQGVPVNMNVETVEGFSGHADREGLMEFVEEMSPQPDRVLCVHGDPDSVDEFSSAIYHDLGIRSHSPKNLETFRFD